MREMNTSLREIIALLKEGAMENIKANS
jgi:hypothetical protein